jgi:hypothetical protein
MELVVPFSDFALPAWTLLHPSLGSEGSAPDPSRLHSVQFQIINNPGDLPTPYSFCVSELAWLDAAGAPVEIGTAPVVSVDAGVPLSDAGD